MRSRSSDAVGNASGLTGMFAGLAGALATAAGVGQTPEGIAALENTPMALSSVAQAAIDDEAPTPAPVPQIIDDDDVPAPVPQVIDEDDLEDIVDAVDAAEPAPAPHSTRTTLDYARGNAPRGTLTWDADKRTYVLPEQPAPSPAPDVAPGAHTTLLMGTVPDFGAIIDQKTGLPLP